MNILFIINPVFLLHLAKKWGFPKKWGNPVCSRGRGGAKQHVSSFIFIFLWQKAMKGFREENSFLKEWADIVVVEGGRRDWGKAQSAAVGEGWDSWTRVIQTFHYQKQFLQQEQHGTSWNVFELEFLIGAHYIMCALWMLATYRKTQPGAVSSTAWVFFF